MNGNCLARSEVQARHRAAFTITEMLVSISIFTMIIGGCLSAHLTGLKMFNFTQAKLGASDEARKSLGDLVAEVRSAQRVAIGTGSSSSFTEIGDGPNQVGSALQIFRADYDPTSNSNSFVRYYRDSATAQIYRQVGAGTPAVLVHCITNASPFSATDKSGTVLTNNDNNQIIAILFQFYQIQYPVVAIGTNQLFDYFQLSAKIARRSI